MNKFILVMTLVMASFCMSGQQSTHRNPLPLATYNENINAPLTAKERNQIIEVYGESAEKYVFSSPHRLKSIKHILRNRVEVKLISNETDKKPCPKLSDISLFDGFVSDLKRDQFFNPADFNPLKYNFEFHSRAGAMYQVDGTNYYIIIKTQYQ